MLPALTDEQIRRLAKLDEEIQKKKEYEEKNHDRKMASARKTGIPYELVDSDAVKIGSLLGLIRPLDVHEGKTAPEPKFSLLDLFFDSSDCGTKYDYSKIPAYFAFSPRRFSEEDRMNYHRAFVNSKCTEYCRFVENLLTKALDEINKVICLTLQTLTIDDFIENVKENITVVLEALEEEDDEEIWEQLHVLRNSLISVISICDYKEFVVKQIATLIRIGKSKEKIGKHLSYIDANLSLFSGFQTKQPTGDDEIKVQKELTVRNHNKDPELKPFDMVPILAECRVTSIMFVELIKVLTNGIIGPYRNNPVCFVNDGFYILKSITGGIRLWILDEGLTMFSEHVRCEMLTYTGNLLYTYWKESNNIPSQISNRLVDAVTLLSQPHLFRETMRSIVKTNSPWFPSELDMFDSFPSNRVIHLAHQVPLPDNLDVKFKMGK